MEENHNQFSAKTSLNYRFVSYFLNNPQITLLLFLSLLITGVAAFFQLRVEGFPEVKIPVAVVTTVVPGAGPETVRTTVSEPLENSLKDLKGLSEISSTSQANFSVLALTFEEGVDINLAVQDARNKVASADLPDGIQQPNIVVPETGRAPFYIAVTGGTDLLSLRKASQNLKTEILALDGVKSFTEISGIDEKIYIDLPPQYQLPQVVEQIKASNIGFPLGEAVIDGRQIPVVASTDVKSLEDVRNIRITLPDGQQKLLADIAQVYRGVDYADKVHRVGYFDEQFNQFKIQPAVLYEVSLKKNADLLDLTNEVEKVVETVKPSDNKVDYAIVLNSGKQSQHQVNEIVEAAIGGKWDTNSPIGYIGLLFGGVWLLVLGMLLLLDWKTALISALAIPLSFLTTFLVLYVTGIQMNTLVLFSFILVLGLIVDPAIVVLESIRRYVDIGYQGKEGVLRSVEVIGLGLFIAVLTSMIVFIPFGLVSGTFGQLISYIPWTVLPALIASYFVPLIFLTWLGSKFIKPEKETHLRDEDDVHTLWPIAQWFIKANKYVLQRKGLQILVVLLGLIIPIGVTVLLFATDQVRQVQFAQPDDSNYIQLSIPRPTNQTYRELLIQSTDTENILKKYAGDINSFFYQSLNESTGGSSTLSVFIELKPIAERDEKSSEIVKKIQADLQGKFGERALASEIAAGPPGASYPVSVKVFENDNNKLAVASEKIAQELRSYKEVSLVVTDFQSQSRELVVKVDSERAVSKGLSAPQIYGQVAGLLGESTLFRLEETSVVLRVPDDTKPTTKEALLASLIYGPTGPVVLGDVASVAESQVASSIRSLNGERYASVNARVKDSRDAINVQRKIDDWANNNTSALGVNERAFEPRSGVNEFEKSFQELFIAIFLSILVTYMAFVIFFRSFAQPFIILFAIPLILIGVFPALAIFTGGQFGFLETIGILMVIGIAENVGIFLIDYANRKVKSGMDKKEAIAIASGIRLRPIILTKVTALAGLLPLAVFSPFWRGLALVVIFGILSSGILSLFTTPVLYNWFTRVKKEKPEESSVGQDEPVQFGYANGSTEPTTLPPNLPI